MPQSMVPMQQRATPGPSHITNGPQTASGIAQAQGPNTELMAHGKVQQQGPQPSLQPRANGATAPAGISPQQSFGALTAPRVLGRNDHALQRFQSRYVSFVPAPFLPVSGSANAKVTLGDMYDPDEIPETSYQYGSSLTTADGILWKWVKALKEGDVAGQNEIEQQLTRFLGELATPTCNNK